jgi:hypothetical protein
MYCSTANATACPTSGLGHIHTIDSSGNIVQQSTGSLGYVFGGKQAIGHPTTANPKMYAVGSTNGSSFIMSIDSNMVKETYGMNWNHAYSYVAPTVMPFNGNMYVSGTNTSGSMKVMQVTSAGVVSQAADTSGHLNVNDYPYLLAVVQQGGVDQELYFTGLSQGLYYKIFKMTTSGNVYQVSNLINGAHDEATGGSTGPWGFTMPSGPSGINEMYFSGAIGSSSAAYSKLFKIYPQNN